MATNVDGQTSIREHSMSGKIQHVKEVSFDLDVFLLNLIFSKEAFTKEIGRLALDLLLQNFD